MLSEAMLLGAMTGPQARGVYFGARHSTCALGAVLVGMGMEWDGDWPHVLRGLIQTVGDERLAWIIKWNDNDVTREEIAARIVALGWDVEVGGLVTDEVRRGGAHDIVFAAPPPAALEEVMA